MQRWFSQEVGRAGWISAISCVVLACLSLGLLSAARSSRLAIVYPILPVALGCVAVGAVNFRRWHGFLESMEACAAAVVNTYKLLGTIALAYLFFSMFFGPVLLFVLLLLNFWSVYLGFYVVVSFLTALVVACASGATLYGLLWLMRYVGELGHRETPGKLQPPRALRMVV